VSAKQAGRPDSQGWLPIPPGSHADWVGQVWRIDYAEVAESAVAWAREHDIHEASLDGIRTLLIAVDMQNTFCTPGFELFVAGRSGRGAVDDVQRLCRFVYHNLNRISRISATLDTHTAMQIFHPIFWVNGEGQHPAPYTLISEDDVLRGTWQVNPGVAASVAGGELKSLQRMAEHYVRRLKEGGKYDLTIWPYHAVVGGIGHALVSALEEALFFHTVARSSQTMFEVKGDNPLTENYSVLKPEVLEGPDGRPIARRNERFIQDLFDYDVIILAGEAKSHCVAWTIGDLLAEMRVRGSALIDKVYLLEDCTSPVVVEGGVDYTEQADAAFARFVDAGLHIVRSTDPMETWSGYPQPDLTEEPTGRASEV
jgi:nicotinamidase-related amidase